MAPAEERINILELVLYYRFVATRTFFLRETITRLNYFFPNTLMEQYGNV